MIWRFVLHIVRCNSGKLNGISHFLYILSKFVITLVFQQISYCLFSGIIFFKSVSLNALVAYLVYFPTYMKNANFPYVIYIEFCNPFILISYHFISNVYCALFLRNILNDLHFSLIQSHRKRWAGFEAAITQKVLY
jgi:hypothetical protein